MTEEYQVKERKEMPRFGFQFCRGLRTEKCWQHAQELALGCWTLFCVVSKMGQGCSLEGWPVPFVQKSTTPWKLFLSLVKATIALWCCCSCLWEPGLISLPTVGHRSEFWPSYQNWVLHKSHDTRIFTVFSFEVSFSLVCVAHWCSDIDKPFLLLAGRCLLLKNTLRSMVKQFKLMEL